MQTPLVQVFRSSGEDMGLFDFLFKDEDNDENSQVATSRGGIASVSISDSTVSSSAPKNHPSVPEVDTDFVPAYFRQEGTNNG